jgi:hypothetical protein
MTSVRNGVHATAFDRQLHGVAAQGATRHALREQVQHS